MINKNWGKSSPKSFHRIDELSSVYPPAFAGAGSGRIALQQSPLLFQSMNKYFEK
jgi:hypothetical protein